MCVDNGKFEKFQPEKKIYSFSPKTIPILRKRLIGIRFTLRAQKEMMKKKKKQKTDETEEKKRKIVFRSSISANFAKVFFDRKVARSFR